MDQRLEPLAAILDLNTDLVRNSTRDLTDHQAGRRLEAGGNSIAFLVAHLIDARHYLAELLGASIPNPIGSALADVESIDEAERLPSLGELLPAWERIGGHLSDVLSRATAARLDTPTPRGFPVPGGTVLHAVAFLAQHDSYHVGQIAFLRRQIGMPAMTYDRSRG